MYESGAGSYDRFMSRRPQVNHEGSPGHRGDSVDVAARYLVYNLYLAVVSGTPGTAQPLRDMDENVETLARAVERGWVEVFERLRKSGDVVRLVALTDEGQRLARRSLH